eukprot:Hpha_TRINITY_DN16249_c0_g6::TRINITY_DN16249_c0_g6_i1::g.12647::m.12647
MQCCRWLSECTVRQTDHPLDARVKRLAMPPVVGFLLMVCFIFPRYIIDNLLIYVTGSGFISAGCVIFLVGAVTNLISARRLADLTMLSCTAGTLLFDIAAVAMSRVRTWSLCVLALDASLVLERHHIPPIVIPIVLVYLAAEGVERVHRWGLYELGYWGTEGLEASECHCASPPCSISVLEGLSRVLPTWSVFLFDFYFTRGFASALSRQLKTAEASVGVAAKIAAALARYDIDAAARVITEKDDLHPDLAQSFMRLLSNLNSYKPYLPHSCLIPEETGERHESRTGTEADKPATMML